MTYCGIPWNYIPWNAVIYILFIYISIEFGNKHFRLYCPQIGQITVSFVHLTIIHVVQDLNNNQNPFLVKYLNDCYLNLSVQPNLSFL